MVEFIPDPATENSTRRYKRLVAVFDLIFMDHCSSSGKKLTSKENTEVIRIKLR